MSMSASFLNGLQIASTVDGMREKGARRKIATEGMEAAKVERQGQIDGAISEVKTLPGPAGQGVLANPAQAGLEASAAKPQTTPADTPGITGIQGSPLDGITQTAPELQGITDQKLKPEAKTSYKVKGSDESFDTRESAAKLAERQADDLTDLYYKNVGPKMREYFLTRGDVEKAEALDGFMEDRATKQGMKHWARGMTLLNMGDTKAGFESLMKAQNTAGFGSDYEITGYEPIKDGKGKETGGMRVKYKDEKGTDGYQDFNSLDDAAMTLVALAAPEKQFAIYDQRRKESAERANKQADRRQKLEDEAWLADYKGRIQRNNTIAGLQTRAALGGLGGGKDGDGEGGGRNPSRQYKHPYDVRLELRQDAEKNSYEFRKMTPAQRRSYLDEIMRTELGYTDEQIKQSATGAKPARGGAPADGMEDESPDNLPVL